MDRKSTDGFFERIDSIAFLVDSNDTYDDNLFQEPGEVNPPLCPHCGLYKLEDGEYENKSVKVCKKDGYLCPINECYSKLTRIARGAAGAIVRCREGHQL